MMKSRHFMPLLVVLTVALAVSSAPTSASAASVPYDFTVDPGQSEVTVQIDAYYSLGGQEYDLGTDNASSSVEGTFQTRYEPGLGNFRTIQLTDLDVTIPEDMTVRIERDLVIGDASGEGVFHLDSVTLEETSDVIDLDGDGEADITGHEIRIEGYIDYTVRIEILGGEPDVQTSRHEIDLVVTDALPTDTNPFQNVDPGDEVILTADLEEEGSAEEGQFRVAADFSVHLVGRAQAPQGAPTPTPNRTAIEELVRSFYNIILAREPEAGAVDAWVQGYFEYAVAFNIDVRFIPRKMGRLFFLSQEYADRNRTAGEFITDCYRAFLRREPSQEELNGWVSGSWNRAEAMTLFAESQEFAALIEGFFPGIDGAPTRNFVTTMYIGLLDRLVDSEGLAYWADRFDASSDRRALSKEMARTVLNSDEFQNQNPSSRDYVVRLYRAFMGRFPNDSEVNYWVGQLDSGANTVDDLIDLFAASQEFTSRLNRYF